MEHGVIDSVKRIRRKRAVVVLDLNDLEIEKIEIASSVARQTTETTNILSTVSTNAIRYFFVIETMAQLLSINVENTVEKNPQQVRAPIMYFISLIRVDSTDDNGESAVKCLSLLS